MECTVKHTKTQDSIKVSLSVPCVQVNGTEVSDLTPIGVHMLFAIASKAPSMLKYEELTESVLKPFNVAGADGATTFLRKKKCEIHRCVCKPFRLPEIIETVRSLGYRLQRDWKVVAAPVQNQSNVIQLVNQVGDALKRAVILQADLPIRRVRDQEQKRQVMVLKLDGHEAEVNFLAREYESATKELLRQLNLSPFEFKYVLVQSILRELYSYVTLSRKGHGISERKWHELFAAESMQKFQDLAHVLAAT